MSFPTMTKEYDDLPKWRRFMYGWAFSIKHGGVRGLLTYPYFFFKLLNITRNKKVK